MVQQNVIIKRMQDSQSKRKPFSTDGAHHGKSVRALKNTNPSATRVAMMMVRAQLSSEPEISSNPIGLDRLADEYTPFISKVVIYRPWAQVS